MHRLGLSLLPLTLLTLIATGPGCTVAISGDEPNGSFSSDGSLDEAGDAEGDWGEESADGDGGDTGTTGGDDGGDPPAPLPDDGQESTETETGGEMCNDVDDVVLYLSPDDSNSMSSPVQVREAVLTDGQTNISAIAIRPWEFMNYYNFPYAPAEDGMLAIHAELRELDDGDPTTGNYQMQIAVASEVMTPEERPPMNVTLVLDTSGSMAGEPIELLKDSCRAIAASLRAGDKVSMVEWDTSNTFTLAGYEVTGPDDPLLLDKIEAVEAGGGTDLNGGLTSGFELAQTTWDIDAINRLVLISDGGANAGITDVELIAENAVYGGSDGIYLVGAGVDLAGTYNDDLMDVVTDAGKGASVFVTDEAEAWKVFNQDFISTMGIAARDVQVELTLPPGFEIVKFSGEEFSGDPNEVDPQHIAPNDAMIFHQRVETCAPEVTDLESEITVHLSWIDPSSFEMQEAATTYTFGELLDADASLMAKGAAIVAYTDALIAIKKGEFVDETLALALEALDAADQALPGDPDLAEIRMVLDAF